MISLSQGPYTYNRFEESKKPDYLDFDKDGDKKEPMTKALKEKGKKKKIEEGEMPDFIQKKIDDKKEKEGKGGKKDDCECKHTKKEMKEEVCNYLMEGGFANNPVSAEVLFNHMSADWFEHIEAEIEEGYKKYPREKVEKKMMQNFDSGNRDKEKRAIKMGDVNSDMNNPNTSPVNVKRSQRGREAALLGKRGY